jgi:hypothetical protein
VQFFTTYLLLSFFSLITVINLVVQAKKTNHRLVVRDCAIIWGNIPALAVGELIGSMSGGMISKGAHDRKE